MPPASRREKQDGQLIAFLNDRHNQSHFNPLFNKGADFDRFLPDAGITTPEHITYTLVRYAKRHPDMQCTILEIPQLPAFAPQAPASDVQP